MLVEYNVQSPVSSGNSEGYTIEHALGLIYSVRIRGPTCHDHHHPSDYSL